MAFTLCSFSACLQRGGGCLLSSASSLGLLRADSGVGMGVNRLYPQLPGQDGDLAQASYLSFPPAFRIQNRAGVAWLGGRGGPEGGLPCASYWRQNINSGGGGFNIGTEPSPGSPHQEPPWQSCLLGGGKQPPPAPTSQPYTLAAVVLNFPNPVSSSVSGG